MPRREREAIGAGTRGGLKATKDTAQSFSYQQLMGWIQQLAEQARTRMRATSGHW